MIVVVLPVPAPARMHSGPRVASAAARCSGFSPSRIVAASRQATVAAPPVGFLAGGRGFVTGAPAARVGRIRSVDGLTNERLRPARVLKLAGIVVAALVVVLAAAAAAVVLWLRTYAPLDASARATSRPGPVSAPSIQPAVGSGGKEVFFPAYRRGRSFVASFTLSNAGHFAVTVEGIVPETPGTPPWIGPVAAADDGVRLLGRAGRAHPRRSDR